jgi:flagellar hook-associated protein 3 FlgL
MPTRITTLTLTRGVLDDVARASVRLAKTQQKLSSGKELTRPSDDPSAVARALQLRTAMEGAQQHQRTVSEAQGWADVTDSALATVSSALQRTRELVIQGATDGLGIEQRRAIAEEVRGLIETVKTAGNASYGGRYVLAGSLTNTPPFSIGGSDAYNGNTDPINRQIGPGVSLPINIDGRSAIGDDDEGLLAAMRKVVTDLEAGDGPALRADVAVLDDEMDDLNAVRARVGATVNRLEIAAGRLAEYEGTTLKLLSDTEDADMAQTMIDYSVQQTALQAGLKAGASIVQNSLLDFLR